MALSLISSIQPVIGKEVQMDETWVDKIQFGLLSSKQIVEQSAVEVTLTTSKVEDGSVYSPAMGAVYKSDKCPTCRGNFKTCNGHFGHIVLTKPVINPKCYNEVKAVLQCVCAYCSSLLINIEQIQMMGLHTKKGGDRLKEIANYCKRIKSCKSCGKYRTKYKNEDWRFYRVSADNKVEVTVESILQIFRDITDEDVVAMGFNPKHIRPENMIFENLPVLPHCSRPTMHMGDSVNEDSLSKVYIDIVKTCNDLKKTSEKDRSHHVALLNSHINTIFFGSEKTPGIQRQFIVRGFAERLGGKRGHFRSNCNGKRSNCTGRSVISPDQNIDLNEIGIPFEFADELWFPETVFGGVAQIEGRYIPYGNREMLQAMVDKSHAILSGQPLCESCKHVMTQKDAKVKCARPAIASSYYCIQHDKYHSRERIPVHGIIVGGKGERRDLKYYKKPIQVGDVVLRRIRDGDWVLFNRQPTLHKMSMMGFKVRLLPGLTLRMNPETCTPFNADFDGDEMNILPAEGVESKAELQELANIYNCIVSPQNHRNVIGVIQDTTLGSYLMTRLNEAFDEGLQKVAHKPYGVKKADFFDCLFIGSQNKSKNYTLKEMVTRLSWGEWKSLRITIQKDGLKKQKQYILSIKDNQLNVDMGDDLEMLLDLTDYKLILDKGESILYYDSCDEYVDPFLSSIVRRSKAVYGEEWMNTRTLISALFPSDYTYTMKNETEPREPLLQIKNGIIVSGALCKKVLGPVQNSIIHDLWVRYSPNIAGEFITKLQRVVSRWLVNYGFSVGPRDCYIKSREEIDNILSKLNVEIEACMRLPLDSSPDLRERYREMKVLSILGQATSNGQTIAKKALPRDCRLRDMIVSGSKGSMINLTQITGCVGQQTNSGQRMKPIMNGNKRVLPHFVADSTEPAARGFIKSSFQDGLSPTELFFHLMGGREGICDTAIKTAETGYIQRRIVKAMEDSCTQLDGTVRTSVGSVMSFMYGDTGLDPAKLVKARDGKPFFCDVHKIAETLNTHVECM
jgi:DNA-directed RNA polymerase beta' subunit